MMMLYEHHQKREAERIKLQAKMAGAEITKKSENEFAFKDPKEYEDMSMEDRQKLTEKMKAHFMNKFGGGKLGG